jgi:hypothetical protein
MCENSSMNAALIFSILLIWVMSCAVCMAWFTAAKRHSHPRHSGAHEDSLAAYLWIGVFAISLAAWMLLRLAMAH